MTGSPSAALSSSSDEDLLAHALAGRPGALSALFRRHRPRLRRMMELRLDGRLRDDGAALDVFLSEALAEAETRFPNYAAAEPRIPVFLWLRQQVGARLADLHRERLGLVDPAPDISLSRPSMLAASSVALAAHLLGRASTPALAEEQAGRLARLQAALNGMEPLDRDVLVLRHFEGLSHQEAALALDLEGAAAARRYVRALKRLNEALSERGP